MDRISRLAVDVQEYGACWIAGLIALAFVLAALSGAPLLS